MKYLFAALLACTFSYMHAQKLDRSLLESGDLIFQDLDCGPMCDAIEEVTRGYEEHRFSHVGLVHRMGKTVSVIEAVGKDVRRIPLDSFTRRTAKPMYVGRVQKPYRRLIRKAILFAERQLGVPYDEAFLYDNGKYYCSELIYDAFMYANKGKPFFQLEPMTFKQPGSAHYYPVWEAYYKALHMEIPEGAPGCNPGGLSRSEKLSVIGTL